MMSLFPAALHSNNTSTTITPSGFGEWLMHVVDMFILLSIGQVVAWLVTIYGDNGGRHLFGDAIATTIGAFIGGYLSLRLISEYSKFSMIFSAFFIAILLLTTLRFRKPIIKYFRKSR